MLGLGGGVFLVPLLNVALGFPLNVAAGVGLMTVVATSSVVARGTNRGLVNLRLGMILQIAAAAGGYYGGRYAQQIPEHTLQLTFAIVTAVIAAIMLSRLERRNVILDTSIERGPFGGRYYEHETGQEVVYRTRRLPAALGVSLVAGSISGLLGIGGGILQVPALNAWCGVPLRAAAATSALMIGVTATGGAIIYYGHGDLRPLLAAPAVLGVQIGSWGGARFAERFSVKWLKLLMSALLIVVAVLMFVRSLR